MVDVRSLSCHYRELGLVSANLGFRVLTARRVADHRPCMLVAPNRFDDPDASRRALSRAADAHARIEHPLVPRTAALVELEGRPILELDAEVTGNALELFRRFASAGLRIPFPAADGLAAELRKALQAAHATPDPERGGAPTCLGWLSGANVFFAPDGWPRLVGFGHNFAILDEHGRIDPHIPHFAAPELAVGGEPSPIADYLAVLARGRTMVPFFEPSFVECLLALTTGGDPELAADLQWLDANVSCALPAQRASIEEAMAVWVRIRARLGIRLEPHAFAAIAARTLGDRSLDPGASSASGPCIALGPGGEWVRSHEGDPRPLRGPMRRALLALVERHQLGMPEPIRSVELIDLAWPEERIEYEAALNRVYVTMNRLRKVLPEGSVERFDDGYRLSSELRVVRAAS